MVNDRPLFLEVVDMYSELSPSIGFVVGATQVDALKEVRKSTDRWILAPGIGAQGADPAFARRVINKNAIFPISRGISKSDDPKLEARG